VGVLWAFCGRFVGVLLAFCGRFVGVLWEFCGRFVGVLWAFCGRFVGVLWAFCANRRSDILALFTGVNNFLSMLNRMFRPISVKLGI
jgi:hypothetical protein